MKFRGKETAVVNLKGPSIEDVRKFLPHPPCPHSACVRIFRPPSTPDVRIIFWKKSTSQQKKHFCELLLFIVNDRVISTYWFIQWFIQWYVNYYQLLNIFFNKFFSIWQFVWNFADVRICLQPPPPPPIRSSPL